MFTMALKLIIFSALKVACLIVDFVAENPSEIAILCDTQCDNINMLQLTTRDIGDGKIQFL